MESKRKNLYQAEQKYVSSLIIGRATEADTIAINKRSNELCLDFRNKAMNSIHTLASFATKLNLSEIFLKKLQAVDSERLSNNISENEFILSCRYVGKLLNVNLSSVRWKHLNKNAVTNSEGFCVSCNDDNHHVFTQNHEFGTLSTDLLVHEIGHAADFKISRLLDDDHLLVRHQSLAEAVAYYCQFSYLKGFGDVNKRKGSLGAFLYTYLSICLLRFCLNNNTHLSDVDIEMALADEEFKTVINSYSEVFTKSEALLFLSQKLNQLKDFGDLPNLIYNEIAPRFGVVLALFLLGKDNEFVKEVISLNSIDNALADIINKIIPDFDNEIIFLQDKIDDYLMDYNLS